MAAPTPAEALDTAVAALATAAANYVASPNSKPFKVSGDYRLTFKGSELLSVKRR